MAEIVESLFPDLLRLAASEQLPEADAASVHVRAGLDLVRKEIEQALIDLHLAAVLYVGAGRLSVLASDLDRYRILSDFCPAVYLFGKPDVELPPSRGLVPAGLPAPYLARDYFCIVRGAGFQAALIAGAIPMKAEDERLLRYNAFLTFDERVAERAASVLEEVLRSLTIQPRAQAPAPSAGTAALNLRKFLAVLPNRLAGRISTLAGQLHQNTLVDALTGLHNQRHFYATLIRQVNRSNRTEKPFSVLFVEVRAEDAQSGDIASPVMEEPVRALAESIEQALRKGVDTGFKLRGNEFGVILEGAKEKDAARVALRIEEDFRAKRFPGLMLKINASEFGTGRSAASLLDYAKRRLKEAP